MIVSIASMIGMTGVAVCAAESRSPELAPDVAIVSEMGMHRAFAELADAQESVRDAARTRLMALPRRYLPSLKKLVETNRPLLPAQSAALRGIVKHIYLAGEPYESSREYGFLGVRLWPTVVKMPPPPREREEGESEDEAEGQGTPPVEVRNGIVITERLPGFVGARLLLDGDIVLSIVERPEVEFPNHIVFSEVIRETPPGKPITFRLLRRGRVIDVPIALDPRPNVVDPRRGNEMIDLDILRRKKAEAYWQETFGPLMNESIG